MTLYLVRIAARRFGFRASLGRVVREVDAHERLVRPLGHARRHPNRPQPDLGVEFPLDDGVQQIQEHRGGQRFNQRELLVPRERLVIADEGDILVLGGQSASPAGGAAGAVRGPTGLAVVVVGVTPPCQRRAAPQSPTTA